MGGGCKRNWAIEGERGLIYKDQIQNWWNQVQPGSKNRKRTHKALTRNITARLTKVPELAAYFKRERFFFLSRYAKTCLLNVISVRTPWCANASKHLLNHHVLFWDIPPSVIQIRLGSVHHPCSSECLFRRPCERCPVRCVTRTSVRPVEPPWRTNLQLKWTPFRCFPFDLHMMCRLFFIVNNNNNKKSIKMLVTWVFACWIDTS